MMLYAATMGTMVGYDETKENIQVLHHILRIVSSGGIGGVRFPNDFAHAVLLLTKFIQRVRSTMFEERDDCGLLPLHIAVSGDSLLRQNVSKKEGGIDDKGAEEGGINSNGGDDTQDENDVPWEQPMDGVGVQADDGDGIAQDEAQRRNNEPLPPQVGGLLVGAQILVEDEGDEEDSEVDYAAGEVDDEDVDTSTMHSDTEIIRLLLDQYPESIRLRDSQSGSLPIHLVLQHNPRAIDVIELLIDLHPRSVTMPNGNGRLPIHLAIIHKSPTWNKVLDLSPIALETRDPVTGLLPFQLSAMMSTPTHSDDEDGQTSTDDELDKLESLTMCFRLLRMCPCLASGLADVKPRRPQSLIEQQIMVWYKPRVTKLEEENERLRQRVEELELKLASMQMMETGAIAVPSDYPHDKKRKSSSTGSYSLLL